MKLDRIVAGTDLSSSATEAVQWVSRWVAPGAEVFLMHVIDTALPARFPPGDQHLTGRMVDEIREVAENRLKEIGKLAVSGVAHPEVHVGRPFRVLADRALELGAGMIVVAAHGERHRPWMTLGTTADRLVRAAGTPVMIVKHPRPRTPKRILLATDRLDSGSPVLRTALELADRWDASVLALHVIGTGIPTGVVAMAQVNAGTADISAGSADEQVDSRRNMLVAAADDVGLASGRLETAVTFGSPDEEILFAADEFDADLVVIGRHGTGRVAPLLLGSTISSVLRGAKSPVLVVAEAAELLDQ